MRNLSSNAGHTCRHMFWSQPKPCAKTIAVGPAPAVWTLLRTTADTRPPRSLGTIDIAQHRPSHGSVPDGFRYLFPASAAYSHSLTGQRARLLHPGREAGFVELVVLADVDLPLLGRAGRDGTERSA